MKDKIKDKKNLTLILTIIVFVIIEVASFYIANYSNIMSVNYSKDDKYPMINTSDLSGYSIESGKYVDDHIEVTGEKPYVTLDISGYVDSIIIDVDRSQTYCQSISIAYDLGDGYTDKNMIKGIFETFSTDILYNINKPVKEIRIYFDNVHYNGELPTTMKLTSVIVNPISIEQCKERIKDYVFRVVIVMIITYTLLIIVSVNKKIGIERYLLLALLTIVTRLIFGIGFMSEIPFITKVIALALNCIVSIFLILLIVRESENDEKN